VPTIFPQPLLLASSFDDSLAWQVRHSGLRLIVSDTHDVRDTLVAAAGKSRRRCKDSSSSSAAGHLTQPLFLFAWR
jgi:hypothetical protein